MQRHYHRFVVRGFITGSSATSLWTVYNKGANATVSTPTAWSRPATRPPVLTPTTKEGHDRPISEGHRRGGMDDQGLGHRLRSGHGPSNAAKTGRRARPHPCDTKYEMGKDADSNLTLVDEITWDSSRYWIADTFEERFAADKNSKCRQGIPPPLVEQLQPLRRRNPASAPEELVVELSRRYLHLYETITGEDFPFPAESQPVQEHMNANLSQYLA